MTLPSYCYGDPANTVDALREAERRVNNCGECRNSIGQVFDRSVCKLGRALDEDGYCYQWRGRKA